MMEAATVGIPLFPSPQLHHHHHHHHHPYQLALQPIAASYYRDPMRNHLVPSSRPIILPVPGTINQVWHRNLEFEFMKIKNLLFCPSDPDDRCFLASIDTEFPGVLSASDLGRLQDPLYNYGKMKENVNATNIIQLGLTLSDRFGNFYIWEFNFSDFNIETDDQNKDSIELLKAHGIDFERNKRDGIPSSEFAKLCRRSGLVGNSSKLPLTWVGFQSSYDFGFLTKILTREPLPNNIGEFMSNVKMYFGPSVFDIKHMNARLRAGVYGGLETVAKTLGVAREVGRSHTAGSDSLLTLQTFIKLVHKLVCLETTDYRISSIVTILQKLTMHSHAKSRAPFDIGLALLITNEERDQKDTYFKLYSCQGALYGLAS